MEIIEGSPHVPGQTALQMDGDYGRSGQGRHATLKAARGPRMPRQLTTQARRSGWKWAVGVSSMVHALVLGWLLSAGVRPAAGGGPELVAVDLADGAELLPVIAAPAAALPEPPVPAPDEAVAARPLDAPEGERDNAVPRTVAPRGGETATPAAPAPDQGQDGGHVRELATRRD